MALSSAALTGIAAVSGLVTLLAEATIGPTVLTALGLIAAIAAVPIAIEKIGETIPQMIEKCMEKFAEKWGERKKEGQK